MQSDNINLFLKLFAIVNYIWTNIITETLGFKFTILLFSFPIYPTYSMFLPAPPTYFWVNQVGFTTPFFGHLAVTKPFGILSEATLEI